VDIAGLVFFAIPFCWLLIHLSFPLVLDALYSGETSPNAGGLVRWPVYALVPLGMLLLLLQCVSELVKHVAYLQGIIPPPALQGGAVAEPANPARAAGG
jgi:TRAP-type mannitol/chloroaromatic compound transport system permease small subunit